MTNPIITEAVRALVDRRDLTRLEAAAAMEAIMSGAATNAQIAAFLTALRMKGETVEELIGFAQVAVTEHSAMHREATGTVTHQQRYADLITELRRHRNQDAGYWVASSTPDAAYHALTGSVPRQEVRRAALLSDGATRLVDRFGTMAWPHLLNVLDREGPWGLIVQTREAESGDPEGRRWPRSKRHDDASAVSHETR